MSETQIDVQAEVLDVSPVDAIERAHLDIQVATARRYPRVLSKVKADMLSFATLDEETAAACFYSVPRADKAIVGPSVRLAEIALSCYCNMRAGSRIVATVTEGENPHVVVQAVATDLEKNTAISIEKRRRIFRKKDRKTGLPKPVDEDDINTAANACSSIALRDAIFKVVPRALITPVYDAARKVAVGDVRSLVAKRGTVIDKLKKMGATEASILHAVDAAKVDDIDLPKLETLIGLGTALKEGATTLEDAFPTPKIEPVQFLGRQKKDAPANVVLEPKTKPPAKEDEPDDLSYEQPASQQETPAEAPEPEPSIPLPPNKSVRKDPVLVSDEDLYTVLEKLVTGWGYTWDQFHERMVACNLFGDAKLWTAWGTIPYKDVKTMIRSQVGLKAQLEQAPR